MTRRRQNFQGARTVPSIVRPLIVSALALITSSVLAQSVRTVEVNRGPLRVPAQVRNDVDVEASVHEALAEVAPRLNLRPRDFSDLHESSRRTSLLATHVAFDQYVDGVRVVDGGVTASLDETGHLARISEHLGRSATFVSRTQRVVPRELQQMRIAAESSLLFNDDGTLRNIRRYVVIVSATEQYAYDATDDGHVLRVIPLFFDASARARLFLANPVTELNDPTLHDQDDSATAVPIAAYHDVELRDLNPGGPLAGPFVTIVDTDAPHVAPLSFEQIAPVDRSNDAFEDEMAYFHLDASQRYLQSLGYNGPRAIADYSLPVDAHAEGGADNSHYVPNFLTPGRGALFFGEGGVDDAEDPDILLHEYAHALQDWIAPNAFSGSFGSEARALAEGISDYWAFSSGYEASVASGRDPFCIGDWDARCGGAVANGCAYAEGADCLRRVDSTKTMRDFIRVDQSGVEHQNGAIWSSVLRKLFMDAINRFGTRDGRQLSDTIVLESLFGAPPQPTYATAGLRLVQSDVALTGGMFRNTICDALRAAEILDDACGIAPRGELTAFPSLDRNVPIPDNDPNGVTLTRHVFDARIVQRVLVRVDIQHPHRGDLRVSLIGPNGVPVLLQQTSHSDAGSDLDVTFGADVEPQESLSVLTGISAAGTWTLQVVDTSGEDVGRVVSWDLILQLEGDLPLGERNPLPYRGRVVAAGHTPSSDARYVTTELAITNRGAGAAHVTLYFTPYGVDGRFGFRAMRLELSPLSTTVIDDVVGRMFFATSVGIVEAYGDAPFAISTRTRLDDDVTSAQTIPRLASDGIAKRGETLELVPLRNDERSRTNIGLANFGDNVARVTLRIFSTGAEVRSESLAIAPHSGLMRRINEVGDAMFATIHVDEGADVAAYSSVITLQSGDAATFMARRAESRLTLHGAVVRGAGATGESWRSALWLSNDSDAPTSVELQLDIAGGASQQTSINVPARSTFHTDDVLHDLFTVDGIGHLTIGASASIGVSLEVIAHREEGERREAFPLRRSASVIPTTFAAHLDAASRLNVGVINLQSTHATVEVALRYAGGGVAARASIDVPANGVTQIPFAIPASSQLLGSVDVSTANGANVIPYISVIDALDSSIQVAE